MSDKIVRQMHDVFGYGIELLERLEDGQSPRFEVEHSKVMSLLLAGGELDFDPVYNGELARAAGRMTMTSAGGLDAVFLGVRYALTCWIDEVFILHAPEWWSQKWREDTMEVRLYAGGQVGGERFWEQARRAEGPRGSPDALEAYLWCVMLGFVGEPARVNPPVRPAVWVENVRKRVLAAKSTEFPAPQNREPPTYVPALTGPARLATMLRVSLVFGAAAVFVLAAAAMSYFKAGG